MRIRLPVDWLFVFGLTASVYTAANFVLPRVFENFFATYVFQPLFLILLAVLIARLPGQRAAGKLSGRPLLVKIALAAALLQIYLAVVAGFFEKFGHSPYSLTPRGVVTNLVYVGAGLAGAEFSRAWLINRLCRKPAVFLPFLITLLYTVFSLPFSQFAVLRKTVEEAVQFFGSTLLPLFAENLLASVFAMWGGALPALVYRGVLQAFYWFSPVLPDLNWAMKALVGTVVPVVGVVVVQQVFLARAHPGRFRRQAGGGLVWWVAGSVAAVIMIWFSLGVFPVRPTVIASGSMRPVMEVGDVAIVGKVNPARLQQGDIIQYRSKEARIPTVHRIVDSYTVDNRPVFVAKGDANNIPDGEPVFSEQVMGKVIFVIPGAGWATIAIRQLLAGS
jgi:signal peptidase